jgi:hypothetical protein
LLNLAELQLRRQEIQGEINGYRGTAGYNDDERTRLKLETALLNREIIEIRGQIQTKILSHYFHYLSDFLFSSHP